jgi:RimJ/RimL family protein N-acetyltransferase
VPAHPAGPDVRLLPLSAAAFSALAADDLAAADRLSPVSLSAYFAGSDWRSVWRRSARQLAQSPSDTAWVTQVIGDVDRRLAVGRAGHHGPPDDAGMVQIGYVVDPAFRRRGYARAALRALLEPARPEPAVHTVRLTIGPDDTPSRLLALRAQRRPAGLSPATGQSLTSGAYRSTRRLVPPDPKSTVA